MPQYDGAGVAQSL